MKKKLIEIAQKTERLSQMQWCDQRYLEGGHSIFAAYSLNEDDNDGLMFTGTYTDPETIDKYPKLDRVNGGSLDDVARVLHEYELITDAELAYVRGEFGYK